MTEKMLKRPGSPPEKKSDSYSPVERQSGKAFLPRVPLQGSDTPHNPYKYRQTGLGLPGPEEILGKGPWSTARCLLSRRWPALLAWAAKQASARGLDNVWWSKRVLESTAA